MKIQKLITIIIFITLLSIIVFNAFARNTDSETTYNNVMEKLKFEPKLDATAITVSIEGNHVVILGGTVKTHAEKTIAENAVKEIRGIRAVIDEMKVNSLAWRKIKTDHDIVTAAMQAFKWHALIPEELVKITVDNGHVTLSGRVDWQYQKNIAWNAVNNLLGVKSIENTIIVKLVKAIKLDTKVIKSKITKEFERHARIDADKIKIEAKGNKIILTGEVRNFDEIDEAEEMAWSIAGVEEVENNLIIEW
jgi:osmotically-inducible protein OsmY